MNKAELKEVAWIGDGYLATTPRGVVVDFHGLNATGLKTTAETHELEYASSGALVVYPYYGPWSWMNREARAFVDELISDIYQAFELPASAPLIITGGSMGGLSSLLYTRYSRHRITACQAMYPVCDIKYHFRERADLPRSIRHAFRGYQQDLETLFSEHSPLKQAGQMPAIPYQVIHGDKDLSVNKQAHSDRFVAEMLATGHEVEYVEVPGMGHGEHTPLPVFLKRIEFVKRFLEPSAYRSESSN